MGSGPRWPHRKTLNYPPLMGTADLQLHMEQFPLKNNLKLAEQLPQQGIKRPAWRQVGEIRMWTCKKAHPHAVTHNREGCRES